jgi:hypothetical protein
MDTHLAVGELGRLIDLLTDMNLYAIERYAAENLDGFMWWDDWCMQDRLMISPDSWRKIWKPRYARIYEAAHHAGLKTFLHSCGHITSILDDLIEIGLDCVQMQQQENMDLELLGKRFGGRITFWACVDIQQTMSRDDVVEIMAYTRRMVDVLGRPPLGGFIATWHGDPKGVGHTVEAIEAMFGEFARISRDRYGQGS